MYSIIIIQKAFRKDTHHMPISRSSCGAVPLGGSCKFGQLLPVSEEVQL